MKRIILLFLACLLLTGSAAALDIAPPATSTPAPDGVPLDEFTGLDAFLAEATAYNPIIRVFYAANAYMPGPPEQFTTVNAAEIAEIVQAIHGMTVIEPTDVFITCAYPEVSLTRLDGNSFRLKFDHNMLTIDGQNYIVKGGTLWTVISRLTDKYMATPTPVPTQTPPPVL